MKRRIEEELKNYACECCGECIYDKMPKQKYCSPCSLSRKKHNAKYNNFRSKIRKEVRRIKDSLEKMEALVEYEKTNSN